LGAMNINPILKVSLEHSKYIPLFGQIHYDNNSNI
jgi:hypothetical protein